MENSANPPDESIITFYRAIPGALSPMRADRGALGVLPTSAFQYCEALTSASAFGWYLFAPMTFYLQWDGTDIIWTHPGADTWYPLSREPFPEFGDYFDGVVPDDIKGFAPPFLSRNFQSGIVQIWSGLFAKTAPNWSLLIRSPANLPRSQLYECFEGIVETDRWFGPLFTNIRLTAIDRPIEISIDRPLFQVQPLRRDTYDEKVLRNFRFEESLDRLSPDEWDAYRETIVAQNKHAYRDVGRYAGSVRKRMRSGGVRGDETSGQE